MKVQRSQTNKKRGSRKPVPHHLRGVVPAIIEAFNMLDKHDPEYLAARLAFLINAPDAYDFILRKNLPELRRYIKKHNLVDWTR